jgi:3-phosphoglycerate kinase
MKPGDVLLLENLRFHAEEEKNDPEFGKQLASLADYFVQDAFGAVHRAHASTAQVPPFLPSGAGDLLEKELNFLQKIKADPVRPYMVVLGGAKVSDKLGVVKAFIKQVDTLFIGGAMAYTFLKAQGKEVGDSRIEPDFIDLSKEILSEAAKRKISLILPQDHLIVQDIEKPETAKTTDGDTIPAGWKGVDIGPKTLAALQPMLKKAKTVFWNGPAGIFEMPAYSKGTNGIAVALSQSAKEGAMVVVGGGDSVAAVTQAGLAKDMTFISTGGGASLEFLEGIELPGVKALPDA